MSFSSLLQFLMNISLKCPHCGTQIAAPATVGLEQKMAECPKCHAKEPVGNYFPRLSLMVGDTKYQLRFGQQWVGRRRENNTAEVQIPDSTCYMSRRHALIEVHVTAAGLECTFEEHGKNPTRIHDVELQEGDIIYLNVNDCLTLGETKMYLANDFE